RRLRAGLRHRRRGPRARERRKDLVGALPALRAECRDARAPAARRKGHGRRRSSAIPGERRAAARSAGSARGRSELRLFILGVLALAGTTGYAQIKSDWERANEDRLKQSQEQAVPPPSLDKARLVEVKSTLAADTDFRFFIDPESVSVGEDRIVRYVLVARSPSGSESVTFEGIRCLGEYRVYAVGHP